jgi:transcriptional regulator with XRE-family HTH domain
LNSGFKSKAEEIEWRRSKVLELKSQGLDQREIAQRLQVSPTLISFDMKFMRKEVLKNIGDYTTKELPLQFRIVTKALQNAIQTYCKLSQEAKDDHDKIDAMEHYIDSHQTLWSLLLGGEKFENDRQFENTRLGSYQQQQQREYADDTFIV